MSRFCQKCGTPASDGDRFCGSCGSTLGSETAAAAPAPATAPPAPAVDAAMTERVERVFKQVGEYLRAADMKFMENASEHSYTALFGSAVTIIRVHPAGTDDTWVTFLAPVVVGAELKPDLLEYLLRKNADWAATKYHLTASNEIWLQYSVFGSILDLNTCKVATVFLMMTADAEDDTIRGRWGGKRAADVMLGVPA